MTHQLLYLSLGIGLAFIMAWGMGANDVANAMGTSVGARALKYWHAMVLAAIFESAGAILAGGHVTNTIRHKVINVTSFAHHPQLLIIGMLAVLMAASFWMIFASIKSWPVSSTHTVIGALVGFALVSVGVHAVQWSQLLGFVAAWMLTPIISGSIAFVLFRSAQLLILNTTHPFHNGKRYIPFYIFYVAMVICIFTFIKGFEHLHLPLNNLQRWLLSLGISILATIIGVILLRRIKLAQNSDIKDATAQVEKLFAVLMIFSACAMAFAHGSNDVSNAVGPLAAIVSTLSNHGKIVANANLPIWILVLGATGIVIGLACYGYNVMRTIGKNITLLTSTHGFAAEIATATTVIIASATGIPCSTTQTLVGAVFGVGLAHGLKSLNVLELRRILLSWVITVPLGAILCIIMFYILRLVL